MYVCIRKVEQNSKSNEIAKRFWFVLIVKLNWFIRICMTVMFMQSRKIVVRADSYVIWFMRSRLFEIQIFFLFFVVSSSTVFTRNNNSKHKTRVKIRRFSFLFFVCWFFSFWNCCIDVKAIVLFSKYTHHSEINTISFQTN